MTTRGNSRKGSNNRLPQLVLIALSFALVQLAWETKRLLEENASKRSLLQSFTVSTGSSGKPAFLMEPKPLASFASPVVSPFNRRQDPMRDSDNMAESGGGIQVAASISSNDNVELSSDITPVSNEAAKVAPNKEPAKDDLIIFYHIFLPDEEMGNRSMSIVNEQLTQIGRSGAFQKSGTKAYVYYNTIGNRTIDQSYMDQICHDNNLHCTHTKHYPEGFEFHTLRDVRLYCRKKPHQNHKVIYMHNKGSFHTQKENSVHLRRSMTTAVSSKECQSALKNDMCNICGLNFSPWKAGPFYPGNFWTAQCQYIKQLLNPYNFRDKALINKRKVEKMKKRGKLTSDLFSEIPSVWGTGRYAAEFWVGSHPSIRPCDVAPITSYKTWERFDLEPSDIDLQLAPRSNYTTEPKLLAKMPNTTQARIQEYFLNAGYLIRWQRYYKQVARGDSWFWNYFPEGHLWKDAVKHHRIGAVAYMLNNQTV